jgi:hypothetical protein
MIVYTPGDLLPWTVRLSQQGTIGDPISRPPTSQKSALEWDYGYTQEQSNGSMALPV